MKPVDRSDHLGPLRSPIAAPEAKSGKTAADSVTATKGFQKPIARDPGCMEWLISLWLLSQCFFYPALPELNIPIGISLTPDRLLFGIVIVLFCMKRLAGQTRVMRISMLELLMVLFSIASLISWSVYEADAKLTRFRTLTTVFTMCIQPFVMYAFARRLQWNRPAIMKLLVGLCLIGTYLGFTGIFEHFAINDLVFPKYILDPSVGTQFGRARGPFAASVVNGGALNVIWLTAVLVWAQKKWLSCLLLVIVPTCLTLYFTDTRGVWMGFVGTVVLLALTRSNLRKPALSVIMVVAVIYVSGVFSKFSLWEDSLFSRRDQTVNYRYANYDTLINMFKENPVFGIGLGNFDNLWQVYFPRTYPDVSDLRDGNNTTILAILGEMGFIGIALYPAILAIAVKICVSGYMAMNKDELEFERRFVIAASGVLLSSLIQGVTSDLRYHEFYNVAIFLYVGIVSSLHATVSASLPDKKPQEQISNRPAARMASRSLPSGHFGNVFSASL